VEKGSCFFATRLQATCFYLLFGLSACFETYPADQGLFSLYGKKDGRLHTRTGKVLNPESFCYNFFVIILFCETLLIDSHSHTESR
jgi:hypothetical protein